MITWHRFFVVQNGGMTIGEGIILMKIKKSLRSWIPPEKAQKVFRIVANSKVDWKLQTIFIYKFEEKFSHVTFFDLPVTSYQLNKGHSRPKE